MRKASFVAGCFALLLAGLLSASAAWPGRWADAFAQAVQQRIEQGNLPGVVYHIEHEGTAVVKATGWRAIEPAVETMTEDTIFDLASLTKVVATTTAIMQLAEQGRLDLEAPVARYLPEFTGGGREKVKVRWLLTHCSGLPPGIGYDAARPWAGYEQGIVRACRERLRSEPGTAFVYSDVNFILLGEIVRRVSGQWLDAYTREHIFEPLGMHDTGFCPDASLIPRIAPTEWGSDGKPLRGVVHDPTSRRMGGRTGHAGLFSTAHDLARFCRMLLNGGILEGQRVLSEATVALMTSIQSPAAISQKRGFGWDIDSRYSSQRGAFFPAGHSFGHTGWTGTSLWIDPASRTFIIFLSNRNHPTEKGSVGGLRGELATLTAKSIADWQEVVLPGLVLPWSRPALPVPVLDRTAAQPVLAGVDVARRDGFKILQGKRLGLITNHTGIARDGTATVDLLAQAPGVELVALFGPEHGIRGELDHDKIKDSRDEKTGLPVYSLYGERREPAPEQLANLDALVFDIQDIGCRFYTYIATMCRSMQVAAAQQKEFIVLDRPNPIGGEVIEGPLREGPDVFVAAHTLPLRHGMTVGEIAQMFAAERKLNLKLTVVKCEGWSRGQWFDQTNLPWINPSPNMRSLNAATLYAGIGLLEFTNLSVGRGTDTPFEVVGAPWIDEKALAAELNAAGIPGVQVTPVRFTPQASKFAKQECRGVRFTITDRQALQSTRLGAALAAALCRRHAKEYDTQKLNTLLLHQETLAALKAGKPWKEVAQLWAKDERDFRLRRRPFLLY